MNKNNNFRSNCPISCGLDIIGDKWSLLIVRDILLGGKRTFKEFANSEEGIATNILSNRLVLLEKKGIITKGKLPNNKKTNIYLPTERGIDLLPIVIEVALWSNKHGAELEMPMIAAELLTMATQIEQDKAGFIAGMQKELLELI